MMLVRSFFIINVYLSVLTRAGKHFHTTNLNDIELNTSNTTDGEYNFTATKLNSEHQLKKTIFKGYRSDVRPVINEKDTVHLVLDVGIQQIIQVNEKSEFLTVSAVFRQYWRDPSLQWDPKDYGNITSINVTPDTIWKPDVVLYNNIDRSITFAGQLDMLKNRIKIDYHGNLSWMSLGILSGKCSMDISYFPFDVQKCKFKFGLWTYHGLLVDIRPKQNEVDLGLYSNNSEWHLIKAVNVYNKIYYGCCVEPYPDMTVEITLKRRCLFYVLNLLFPMILFGVLTLLSFYLPAESGERVSFAVTLLLAMTVFMLIVADMVPASSETVPLLGLFFIAVMLEIVMMVFTMCYTLKLHHRSPEDDEEISFLMRRIVYNFLAFKLKVRADRPRASRKEEQYPLLLNTEDVKFNTMGNPGIRHRENVKKIGNLRKPHVENRNKIVNPRKPPVENVNDATAELVAENLKVMEAKHVAEETEKRLKTEYEVCARTLDIAALIVYVSLFVVITVVYLLFTLSHEMKSTQWD